MPEKADVTQEDGEPAETGDAPVAAEFPGLNASGNAQEGAEAADAGTIPLFSHADRVSDGNLESSEEPEEVRDIEQEPDGAGDENAEEIRKLENILVTEFSDTLAGPNAATLSIGIGLLVAAVLAWFLGPILALLRGSGISGGYADVSKIIGVVLALAGVHLVFYWTIHRVSNAVKSRELDRLLEERRTKYPCKHLDCREMTKSDDPVDKVENAEMEGPRDDDLVWQCSLFSLSLEGNPLCAVCDRYERPEFSVEREEYVEG